MGQCLETQIKIINIWTKHISLKVSMNCHWWTNRFKVDWMHIPTYFYFKTEKNVFNRINIWIVRTMYLTSKRPFHYTHSLHGALNKLQTLLKKTQWSCINSMTYNIVIYSDMKYTHFIYICICISIYKIPLGSIL